MLKNWRKYLAGVKADKAFLHRSEFQKKYPECIEALPAIFTENGDDIQILVSAEEINTCENLEELISLVEERVGARSAGAK